MSDPQGALGAEFFKAFPFVCLCRELFVSSQMFGLCPLISSKRAPWARSGRGVSRTEARNVNPTFFFSCVGRNDPEHIAQNVWSWSLCIFGLIIVRRKKPWLRPGCARKPKIGTQTQHPIPVSGHCSQLGNFRRQSVALISWAGNIVASLFDVSLLDMENIGGLGTGQFRQGFYQAAGLLLPGAKSRERQSTYCEMELSRLSGKIRLPESMGIFAPAKNPRHRFF